MPGLVMARLLAELVYENKSWIIRLDQRQYFPIADPSILLQFLIRADFQYLVIDLSKLPRVDSNGLKLLLGLYQECMSKNIQVILRNPSPHLERILQIMQLNRLFPIEHENEEAQHG